MKFADICLAVFAGSLVGLAKASKSIYDDPEFIERGIFHPLEGSDSDHPRRLQAECSIDNLPPFTLPGTPETIFSFVGMGDTPYFLNHRYCLNRQLQGLPKVGGPGEPSFIIHVGDIKSGKDGNPCNREAYNDIAEIFDHPKNKAQYDPKDVLFVVGDNELSDCEDMEDAWSLWMEHFGPGNPYGFGELTSGVSVDRDGIRDGTDRSENFAFLMNQTLVVGLHIIGGPLVGDEKVRLPQNMAFLKERLAHYSKPRFGLKGVVIVAHAQPLGSDRGRYFGNDLEDLAAENPDLPMMFFHGNGHNFCVSYPFVGAPNLVDVEVDDGDSAPPITVSLNKIGKEYRWAIDRGLGRYRSYGKKCPVDMTKTWYSPGDPTPSPGPVSTPVPTEELLPPPRDPSTTAPSVSPENPPTVAPSTAPPDVTNEPTKAVVLPPPFPELQFRKRPPKSWFPLGECQGRCTRDSDCQKGLVCFKRTGTEKVEGCSGTPKNKKDYCVDPAINVIPTRAPKTPRPTEAPKTAQPTSPPPTKPSVTQSLPPTKPRLEYVGDNNRTAYPLQACQGDCDNDRQCDIDLYCKEREDGDPVEECPGKPYRDTDYCVPIPATTLAIVGNDRDPEHMWPLAMCRGDCDDDSDCGTDPEGNKLKCYKRKAFEKVPGCDGLGEDGKDYCGLKKTAMLPTPAPKVLPPPKVKLQFVGRDPKKAPDKFPLGNCQGDCDSNAQCQNGYYCTNRVPGEPVPQCRGTPRENVDYCVPWPAGELVLVGKNVPAMAQHFPLGKCQGDCDKDVDCKEGLKCKKRKGTQAVAGCNGLGIAGEDYCYDPKDEGGAGIFAE